MNETKQVLATTKGAYQKQQRSDTAANWSLFNPVLMPFEFGFVEDSKDGAYKVGDGVTEWSKLPTLYPLKNKDVGVTDDHLDDTPHAIQNRVVKHKFDEVDQQIQALMAKHVSFSASVNHPLIFVNEGKSITVSAAISGGTGTITITRSGHEPWVSAGGVSSFSHQDTVKGVYGTSASYTVTTNVFGIPFSRPCKVEGVYPVYVGAAKTKEQVGVEQYKIKTPAKSLPSEHVITTQEGDKVFFLIPPGVKEPTDFILDKVMPMTFHQNQTLSLNGTTYKVFEYGPVNKGVTLKIAVK